MPVMKKNILITLMVLCPFAASSNDPKTEPVNVEKKLIIEQTTEQERKSQELEDFVILKQEKLDLEKMASGCEIPPHC